MEDYIHRKICKYFRILKSEKWYKHQPESITEAKEAIILWDLIFKLTENKEP